MSRPTKVVNLYQDDYDEYIGRPGKGRRSIWGNPYSAKRDGITVEESIARYEKYIVERLFREPDLRIELRMLRGKRLGCFCKPKICHGDVLAELADTMEKWEHFETSDEYFEVRGDDGRRFS